MHFNLNKNVKPGSPTGESESAPYQFIPTITRSSQSRVFKMAMWREAKKLSRRNWGFPVETHTLWNTLPVEVHRVLSLPIFGNN